MSDENHASYELYAEPAGGEEAALRRVGRYPTYEEALRAHDEDVIDQLAARGGWYTLIEHVIVGPGLRGPEHRLPARDRARGGSGGREGPGSPGPQRRPTLASVHSFVVTQARRSSRRSSLVPRVQDQQLDYTLVSTRQADNRRCQYALEDRLRNACRAA